VNKFLDHEGFRKMCASMARSWNIIVSNERMVENAELTLGCSPHSLVESVETHGDIQSLRPLVTGLEDAVIENYPPTDRNGMHLISEDTDNFPFARTVNHEAH